MLVLNWGHLVVTCSVQDWARSIRGEDEKVGWTINTHMRCPGSYCINIR